MKQSDVFKLPDGKHEAGNGLRLVVRGTSRLWVIRKQINGKRLERSLGAADELTLAMAQFRAIELVKAIKNGEVEESSTIEKKPVSSSLTVAQIANVAIERKAQVVNWKNKRSKELYESVTRRFVLPVIGKMKVQAVTRDDVLRVLSPIWYEKSDISRRTRLAMEIIFAYAIVEGMRSDNPALWKGNLDVFLPAQARIHQPKHLKAPTLPLLREAVQKLWERKDVGSLAVLFGILTACRASEFAKAQWNEIDVENKIWTIPPERRKDGKNYPHRVPLSTKAIELLQFLPRRNDYVFSGRYGEHIHEYYPRVLLCRIAGEKVTMHGCRSTFRDWCAVEEIEFDLAEKCLMHNLGNTTTKAYLRTDLLEQRRPVMQRWANELFRKKS